jgi:type II secretory ATPase GspE/PulE/Tfp pilus assembly ATPase PilB-like protein
MNAALADKKTLIESKVKEAEVYRSMGLLDESLRVYDIILSGSPELDPASQAKIKQRIDLLRKEIANQEKADSQAVSTKDISSFKKVLASNGNAAAILDSASAFKELSLYNEAVAEYEKLLHLDYPVEKVIPEIVSCLLRVHSPSKLVERAEKITSAPSLGTKKKAQIKFRIGIEMEKRDNKLLALNLYRSAREMDPDESEIKSRLDSVMASLSSGSKYDYLLNQKHVTRDQLQQALALSKKTRKSVEFILLETYKIRKEEMGKSLSFFYGSPFKTYDAQLPAPTELLGNLKKTFLQNEVWVPLSWGKDGVEIFIDDPRDLSKTDHIRALLKTKKIHFSVGIKEDIEAYIKRFFDERNTERATFQEEALDEFELLPDVSFEEEGEPEEDRDLVDESSSQVVKLVDQVIVSAYRKNASDIHIEPSAITKTTKIRFRIDGVCQDYIEAPNSMARAILSRIKVMARLDIAERRLPQDGKVKFKRKGIPPFELRLATLPTSGGFEDAVLRILSKAGAMKLEEMGFNERNLRIMKQIISQPYGLVLVVGPTGSGKTTTLHSALGHINKPGIKIWTAEDPVEITQPGLRQVEAKPLIGLDFARIMRSFLRADPDVIMIGEMRDKETANTGVEASLTGHLVFSTLHTNSAPETVTRLLDMGLNPLNFSDALLGVLAQRLVRRLCTECRTPYHPSKEEFEELVNEYGREFFELTGIKHDTDLQLYRPAGCEVCSGTGYKGRMAIHELMEGTVAIKNMIKKEVHTDALFVQAMKEGTTTLKQDGILKVFKGLTDISEVRRVCVI